MSWSSASDGASHPLNRPERRNAITVAMYAALADAIEGAASDPEVRLITLEGDGEDFTAGNDLADFIADMPPPGPPTSRCGDCFGRWPRTKCRCLPRFTAMRSASAPTILFHCDLVIAEEGTRFVMPFVDLAWSRKRPVR